LLVSSELSEVIGMSDRTVVMSEGRVTAIADKSQMTPEQIMSFATGFLS